MGVDKESSKRGGYVGGFFQLFDWTAKSRKKLFSSKSDLPERLKQGKKSDGNLPMTRLYLMDEDETGAGTSIRGSSDYSCASSVTDDDGCGARAPGVVARLMGLNSLPTSSLSEPNSTPFFDSRSLQDSSNHREHFHYHDSQVMYPGNVLKRNCPPRDFLEAKPQKVLSRPIEKFQTEILPPKSAKSIPVTHHKLLSPIKSPGFIPSKSAAHIMEAAAKIIEASPQAAVKAKMPIVGTSSVPLKVRDLKEKLDVAQKVSPVGNFSRPLKVCDLEEKVEAAHKTSRLSESSTRRTVESNAAKYLKGQSLNKSWNGSVETPTLRAIPETEDGSSGLKNKGKSISLAIQAKVNVQRREGLNSSNSQGLVFQKEQSESLSAQPFKSQPNPQKALHRRTSTNNTSGVLRQNNQKQNCLVDKDKLASTSVSNSQSRKVLSGNPSPLRHKTSGKSVGPKSGSRKLGLEGTDSEKGISSYNKRNISRKKRSIDGNLHPEKSQLLENTVIQKGQKATECSLLTDKHVDWVEESKRKGMDVVSFTFTAPLTRSISGSGTGSHVGLQSTGACVDNGGKRLLLDADGMKLSSVGYSTMGGDALSTLLEQKLRELSKSVESSCRNSVKVKSTSNSLTILQDLVCTLNAGGATRLHSKEDQNDLITDRSSGSHDSDIMSFDSTAPRLKKVLQGVDDMEKYRSKPDNSTELLDFRRPSPISVLEPSCSTESCSSLDSTDSGVAEESKLCSSIRAQDALVFSPSMKFPFVDANMDLLDSASSTFAGIASGNKANTIFASELAKSTTDWEVEYIKKILINLESMFEDFTLGQAREIINPHLFDQLELWKDGYETDAVEARLERKLLFDCVSECLDLKCRQYVNGGYRTWMKGATMLKRKGKLSEEVYKEISAWRGTEDSMVDELVDKDMSCQYGRWLDFQVDALVLAVEVEGQIFSSLVNEVVADILRF